MDKQNSEFIYGKSHHKPKPTWEETFSIDENYQPPFFANSDLQNELEVSILVLQKRLKSLGIEQEQLAQLFPDLDFTQASQTIITLSKGRLIKTLRDLKIYEEDLFEQLHDLIPTIYERAFGLTKRFRYNKTE